LANSKLTGFTAVSYFFTLNRDEPFLSLAIVVISIPQTWSAKHTLGLIVDKKKPWSLLKTSSDRSSGDLAPSTFHPDQLRRSVLLLRWLCTLLKNWWGSRDQMKSTPKRKTETSLMRLINEHRLFQPSGHLLVTIWARCRQLSFEHRWPKILI